MEKFKETLKKISIYNEQIFPAITKSLELNNIEYETDNSYEIICHNETKNKIWDIIKNEKDIPNDIKKIDLCINEVNKNVYIRKKFA